jgi:hypothetical protein
MPSRVGLGLGEFSAASLANHKDSTCEAYFDATLTSANAIIGVSYDAPEPVGGVTEVLAYCPVVHAEVDRS